MMESAPNYTEITESVLKEMTSSEFTYRNLELADYDKGFPQLLPQLTVGMLTKEAFTKRFNELQKYQDLIQTIVCEDNTTKKVIGTVRFFIEPKYIRNAGTVLHFEDLVVDETYRRKGIGSTLVKIMKKIGDKRGCYKCLADARKELLPFYEKAAGFKPKEVSIAVYNEAITGGAQKKTA